MRKLLILSCFALLSGALQGQTLWGGYRFGVESKNNDSVAVFNASDIRTFMFSNATGTGAPVLANSPTLVTPALGTPSSGNLANCVNYPVSQLSGTLSVAGGGTGATTLTGLLQGNGTGAFTAITNSTTVGQCLRVTASNTYGWGALDLADADAVTGSLPYGNGGRDVVTGRSTAQTAAVASVATLTVGGADASYEISGNILITTSGSEAFSLQVDYTDDGNTARTATIPILRIATGAYIAQTVSASGAVPYPGGHIQIRCKASTAITIKTSGTFTGCTYNVEGSISRI